MKKYSAERSTLFLYGLENSSHDFYNPSSLGKNTFTNAFPIALAQYLALKRKLPIPLIRARFDNDIIYTEHKLTDWGEIIGATPINAKFHFEQTFSQFEKYTDGIPNKSDVVIENVEGQHTRPLEIKLVVVPNSQTSAKEYEDQSCEIVVRPPTIEQLAFSIANSFGQDRRVELLNIITDSLQNPMDFQWSDEFWMKSKLPNILEASKSIIKSGIDIQTPFALTAIWRTIGQKPVLQENAFDIFVWTDFAFLQLFIDSFIGSMNSQRISRTARSVIWLVSALFDYSAQRTLNFSKHHSTIIYGSQTDKAGAFAGDVPLAHLKSKEFYKPRISKGELESILSKEAFEKLMPERRLDGAIMIQHLISVSNQETI